MVITDSKSIYEQACQKGMGYSHNKPNYSRNNNTRNYATVDLEPDYFDLIRTMFYELITLHSSDALSLLCSRNDIYAETVNFRITASHKLDLTYDLFPILAGLNAAFEKDMNECRSIFSKYKQDLFQGKVWGEGDNYKTYVMKELKILDNHIERVLSATSQSKDKPTSAKKPEKTKEAKPLKTIFRIHSPELTDKFNQFAENRKANDFALSEQIQQLQLSLQEELKQIISIRDGIDYNITQEAISQFISLFSLISETLQYHPNEENKDSYFNLIESCEDFLGNIEQSLAMLGVTIINDVGKSFDSEKHKVTPGMQPTRSSTVSKVLMVGFSYKNKVLEKAEVELAYASEEHHENRD